MGQQQLLLLVLGIVIVGLAVVVGIQAFSENQAKANVDAMTNDAIRIASDAQAWALKPEAFGGGDGEFTGVTLTKLGISDSTANGAYTLTPNSATEATILATSLNDTSRQVSVSICGFDSDDIKTSVGSSAPGC